jgi:hypothetical protein
MVSLTGNASKQPVRSINQNTGSFTSKHWEFYIKTLGVLYQNTGSFLYKEARKNRAFSAA